MSLFFITVCNKKRVHDYPQIIQGDTLRVITLNTSTSFFLYRDQPMGYHYEMVRDFCNQHGLVSENYCLQKITGN